MPSTVVAAALEPPDIRKLVALHVDSVWRTLRRFGVPESMLDDGCQQVFLVATRKLDQIEPGGERGYLLGIAVRVASEMRRSIRRRREVSEEAAREPSLPEALQPDVLLERKRDVELLERVLAELSPLLRECFVLFEIEQLTAHEVARILDIPSGTVASRVRRARDEARAALARMKVTP